MRSELKERALLLLSSDCEFNRVQVTLTKKLKVTVFAQQDWSV